MKKVRILLLLGFLALTTQAQVKKEIFDFEFEGFTLNGILNIPDGQEPKGLVLIVHGSGRTNAVAKEWYADVRAQLVESGYATYMWDKMGCGKSEGTFDIHQPIQNSAEEVIAAIRTLQKKQIPGADSIGLWGVSRAGWINPLVIKEYKDIKFWISVSGVDAKENFKYLLEENLRIDGLPEDSIQLIVDEWQAGVNISHAGGSYEACRKATVNFRNNAFMRRFNGGKDITKAEYYAYQEDFMKQELDEVSGLPINVSGFEELLAQIDCPVLALFGEKDKNVDWKKTKALYEQTLGKNTELSIQSFPDCNHNMFVCQTGGFYEFQDSDLPRQRCDGFLAAMAQWLEEMK
ncbi:MAG: alpha/beta hydrolase [Bacteroidota bacterium]